MTQRRSRRKPYAASNAERISTPPLRSRTEFKKTVRDRFPHHAWDELRAPADSLTQSDLTKLIEHDAPLRNHSGLVLMYGPFQAEMQSDHRQGVASWLKECVRKHGIPSLVRYDNRHRAQVFRRDQFQPWLEPLLEKVS